MSAGEHRPAPTAGVVSIEVAAGVDAAPLIAERRWLLFSEAERRIILAELEGTSTAQRELGRQIRATLEQ